MTGPVGDVTDNYTQIMAERGWTWGDLADDFARQAAEGRALDGGASMRGLERWARSQDVAGRLRAQADEAHRPEDAPPPADPRREPPKRTAVPPAKRTG
jgi:hypothetical protein